MNLKKKSRIKFDIFTSLTGKSKRLVNEGSTPILLGVKQKAEEESIHPGKLINFQNNILLSKRYCWTNSVTTTR